MKNLYPLIIAFLFIQLSANAQTGMGIGTNNPGEQLDVVGAVKVGTDFNNGAGAPAGGAGTIRYRSNTFEGWDGSQWVDFGGGGGSDADWTISGVNQYSAVSGNVGIGTVSPGAKLEVTGQVKITGGTPGVGKVLTSDGTGLAAWQTPSSGDSDWTVSGANQYSAVSGNVGIGFASPNAKLEVNGTLGVGPGNTISGAYASALGALNTASATYSFAGGQTSTASGNQSIAYGREVTASGNYSTAFGRLTVASGTDATALGNNTTASGAYALATGQTSTASGNYSTAIGQGNIASGVASTAIGTNASAPSYAEVSIGTFNTLYTPASTSNFNNADRLLVVGNGPNSLNRSNALTIYKTGKVNINDAYDLPTADGTSGQILTTDGSGSTTWSDPAAGSSLADNDNDTKIQVEETADEDKIRFDTGNSERMIIDENGNVGIGTSTPVNLLHVQNNVSGLNFPVFLRNSSVTNGDGAGIGFLSEPNGNWTKAGLYYERTGGFGTGKLHFLVDDVADNGSVTLSESRLTIKPDGNVGIGTTAPTSKLTVNGGESIWNANEIQFYNDGGTTQKGTIGQYAANSDMVLASNQSGQWLRIGANNSSIAFFPDNTYAGGSNPDVVISSDGRIGVGTTTPIAPLHVESTSTASYGNFWFYSGSGYAGGACCGGSISGVAIHANGRVMASEFDAFSDARIKDVIGISNTEADLETLLAIEITDYRMKDKAKDVKPYKKVIAQQVEQVYPEAVSTITDVIPDIYTLAIMKNGYIELKADVQVGDRVKLISEEGTDMATVTSVDNTGFAVDAKGSKEVFVYGREVNDFRTVDYEAISMLNVSATQELYELIQQLRSENNKLKASVAEFKTMAEDIENLKRWTNFEQQSNLSQPKN